MFMHSQEIGSSCGRSLFSMDRESDMLRAHLNVLPRGSAMKFSFPRNRSAIVSCVLTTVIFVAPLRAQQTAPKVASAQATDPTFDTLLSADSYKMYVELRNVGQLLTTGGAGEIIEPII